MVLLLAMFAKPMSISLGRHSIHLMARRAPPRSYARAMKEMLSHNEPALRDVVTTKQELSMPPTIEPEQVKGFSLWILRAVMNGRVIDLAKTNLLPR